VVRSRKSHAALLHYKDVQRVTNDALRTIGKFVRKSFDESQLADVAVSRSSRVRATAEDCNHSIPTTGKRQGSKRKVGGYLDYLSMDDLALCNNVLARLDYGRRRDEAFQRHGISYAEGQV
jgi:hypothetical protein